MSLAYIIYVWGMAAIVAVLPTGLVVMWALDRNTRAAHHAAPAREAAAAVEMTAREGAR